MLTLLSQLAFAADTATDAVIGVVEEGERRTVRAAAHLGVDLSGLRPGLTGRLDLGQRVAVDGVVYTGVPIADGMKWTGGASLGLSLAPIKVRLGSKGSVDLRVGVGGRAQTTTGMTVSLGGLDWSAWTSGTFELSPDGRWTFYGGLLADQLEDEPALQPTGGVRVRLD